MSPLIYSQECIDSAVAAYSNFCSVVVLGDTPRGREIEIRPMADVSDEFRLVREFLNYLLDLSLENHLSKA